VVYWCNYYTIVHCSLDIIEWFKYKLKKVFKLYSILIHPPLSINRTYPDAKPVRQHLRAVNPRKVPTIKVEVEKLLNADFIYSVFLSEWVSNPIPMNKNKGTIHMCMEFRDLNKACPKDNFPMPFIDQILDKCAGRKIFSFVDRFFRL
jgi:hypothetical protein